MTHLAAGVSPSWVLEMNSWALSVGLHRPILFGFGRWFPRVRGDAQLLQDGDLIHPSSGLKKPGEGLARILNKDEKLGEGKVQDSIATN